MKLLFTVVAGIAAVALLGDAHAAPWDNDHDVGPPTAEMLTRSRLEKEAEVAVAKPGVKVCRELTVGIAVRDWIRGVVVEVASGSVGVRIDDPGYFSHTLNGIAVVRGTVVWDAVSAWTPCL